MNKYEELKSKHEEMVHNFPMAFAFSDKQFKEAMEKLNVTSPKELIGITGGGMIRKSDKKAYHELFQSIEKENQEARQDDEYLAQAFLYELANHEFCITYDLSDALSALGITVEELEKDERQLAIFCRVRELYLGSVW